MKKILLFLFFIAQINFIFSQTEKAKIALLIDDVGNNIEVLELFFQTKLKLNFAVIPFLANSAKSLALIQKSKNIAILHMPMESFGNEELNSKTKGLLRTQMSELEIKVNFEKALNSQGNTPKGFNNHMGSKFTSNTEKMSVLLKYAHKKNMYFIDSNTYTKIDENGVVLNAESGNAYLIAKNLGMKTIYNSLFIDNSNQVENIEKALFLAAELAKMKGSILIIGHCKENTAKALKNVKNQLINQQVEFVFLTELF